MSCFRENWIVRREYVKGSGGVLSANLGACLAEEQAADTSWFVEDKDCIIVQWEGTPSHDSGYHAHYFPATMKGLKLAHDTMNLL